MRRPWLASWIVVLVAALASPARASEPRLVGSARLGLGFGGRLSGERTRNVFELDLRGDALAELERPGWLRLGPAIELRSASTEGSGFRSFEAAAGLALSADVGDDAALSSTTLLGGAYRADRPSSAQLVEVLSLGFRDWESRPRYASSTSLFVALHAALGPTQFYELTGGVEVDWLFLGTPFILLRDRIRGR